MRSGHRTFQCAAVALFVCFFGSVAEAQAVQVDQGQLVEQLRGADLDARYSATRRVFDMGPEHASPDLREALISALADEVETLSAWRQGDRSVPENQHMVARMAWIVADWEDPRAIAPLAQALGTGSGAIRGLARFGEPAVAATVEAAQTPEGAGRSGALVADALRALRLLAEDVGRTPLSNASREEILAVARDRLEPMQGSLSILLGAINLASVLEDPDLWKIIEAMATDPGEIESRLAHLDDLRPDHVEFIQQVAVDRMNGIPPQPRWEDWNRPR